MAPIVLGQRFQTLAEFKRTLRTWAIESSFTPAILDSDSRRVRAGCRSSPDCPFRIRCNFNEKASYASVTTLEDVHNCASGSQQGTTQSIRRGETCKLKFLLEAVPTLINVNRSTPTKSIIDAVKAKYGQEIAMRQAQKVKAILVPRAQESCQYCRVTSHASENCPTNVPVTVDQQSGTDENMGDSLDSQIPDITENETPGLSAPSIQTRPPDASRLNLHSLLLTPSPQQNSKDLEHSNGMAIDPLIVHASNLATPRPSGSGQYHFVTSQGPGMNQESFVTLPAKPTLVRSQETRSSAEVRLDAARLMQRAAELTQEAATLNFEAARLMASVANS